jgi:hypothetical protein
MAVTTGAGLMTSTKDHQQSMKDMKTLQTQQNFEQY